MRCRGLVVAGIGLSLLACDRGRGRAEHPDDPVNASPPSPSAEVEGAEADPTPPEPDGPGIANLHARKFDLVRDAVPCPDACARGEARARCSVAADVRFLDLIAKGSHRDVRSVLEQHRPGIDRCFAPLADAGAERLPSFRIPLDFVIAPGGGLESREDPLYEPDPQLEQMLACVGTWLDGLSFHGAGRPLPTRVLLSVEPTSVCTGPG